MIFDGLLIKLKKIAQFGPEVTEYKKDNANPSAYKSPFESLFKLFDPFNEIYREIKSRSTALREYYQKFPDATEEAQQDVYVIQEWFKQLLPHEGKPGVQELVANLTELRNFVQNIASKKRK